MFSSTYSNLSTDLKKGRNSKINWLNVNFLRTYKQGGCLQNLIFLLILIIFRTC